MCIAENLRRIVKQRILHIKNGTFEDKEKENKKGGGGGDTARKKNPFCI